MFELLTWILKPSIELEIWISFLRIPNKVGVILKSWYKTYNTLQTASQALFDSGFLVQTEESRWTKLIEMITKIVNKFKVY